MKIVLYLGLTINKKGCHNHINVYGLSFLSQDPVTDQRDDVNSNAKIDEENNYENYESPDNDCRSDLAVTPVSNVHSKSPNISKRPLPAIPKDEEEQVVEKTKPPKLKKDTPSKPVKFASRPLPPPPSFDSESQNSGSVIKSNIPEPPSKPKIPAQPNKPKIPAQPVKSQGPSERKENAPTDFASMLKSKLAARAQASSDSEEEFDSKKNPPKPNPKFPVGNPSELVRNSRENSPQPANSVSKGFSKPTPPSKLKPTGGGGFSKPNPPSKNQKPTRPSLPEKPGLPAVALKPVNNTRITDSSNDREATSNKSANVKAMMGMFDKSPDSKPAPPTKPKIAVKPKPGVPAKPTKPTAISQPPSNLVYNLAKNLNLGQTPSSKADINQNTTERYDQDETVLKQNSSGSKISCTAMYDFAGENEGEISFCAGDEMEILEDAGDWTLVRFYDEDGWAPSNYLSKV